MSMLKIDRLKKQNQKLLDQIALKNQIHEMELMRLNNHWSSKFDMIVGMFEIQAKEAGTISELRKWFKEWTDDVNAINAEDENCDTYIADLVEKHGFEFEVKSIPVSHREILEKY
jgi:hypothetical protein